MFFNYETQVNQAIHVVNEDVASSGVFGIILVVNLTGFR